MTQENTNSLEDVKSDFKDIKYRLQNISFQESDEIGGYIDDILWHVADAEKRLNDLINSLQNKNNGR